MSKFTCELIVRSYINRVITKFKHESFQLDNRIPLSYLFFFFGERIIGLLYGSIYLLTFKKICVHHTAVIKCKNKLYFGGNLNISKGCYIDALSREGIVVGSNVSFGMYTCLQCSGTLKCIGKGIKIGNNVGLGTHGFFGCAGGVEIGDNTIFGNYVSVHSENHNYSKRDIPIRLQGVNRKGIKIGKDCWIGAKVTILDGSEIGDGCVVAAGSVVRGCIPPYSIIAGIPAKVIKSR